MGEVDVEWLEYLRSAWWPLEYVNAWVLGDTKETLSESNRATAAAGRDEFPCIARGVLSACPAS